MPAESAGPWTLTSAEIRLLAYLPTHLTFREIAERMHLSPHTIKTQAMSIYGKLEASSRREALERAVEVGRKIATVMGGDVQGALENLSLAAANLSFMRLDQMGISATKVRERMAELTAANANLGKEQAFLQAAMEIANKTFAGIDTSAAVSGLESLTSAWRDLRTALAEGPVGDAVNSGLRGAADTLRLMQGDDDTELRVARGDLAASQQANADALERQPNAWGSDALREQNATYERAIALLDQYQAAIDANVPGVTRLHGEVMRVVATMSSMGSAFAGSDEWVARLADLEAAFAAVESQTSGYQQALAQLEPAFVETSSTAQAVVAQIAQLDIALANGKITVEAYTTALAGFGPALAALQQQAANVNVPTLGLEQARPQLEALGYVLDASGAPVLDPKSGEAVKQQWAPDYEEGVNDGSYLLEFQYKQAQEKERADAAAAREWASAAKQTQSEFEAAAAAMVQEWESRLDQVPGLMGTTSVTDEDVALSKAGAYQEKPDEWLRQLAAEVASGRDEYAGADIRDAATRAGLSPDLDPKAILAQVSSMWEDSSLFAGGKNLDLINQEAVKQALARQDAAASGEDALRSLFPMAGGRAAGTREADVDPALVAAQMADADPAQMVASLAQGLGSEETANSLRDIGLGMAGHLYAGFAGGVAEQDWSAPILDNLMGRLVAQTAAQMTAALAP